MVLKVKKLCDSAKLPTRSYDHAAGYDLYADHYTILSPRVPRTIPTGIALEIPTGYVGLIFDRSGLGSSGISRLAGVIDSDYRGEINVCLINLTHESKVVYEGEKVAQIVFVEHGDWAIEQVDELSPSTRGNRGFGSSG